jgi:hypothetical protein
MMTIYKSRVISFRNVRDSKSPPQLSTPEISSKQFFINKLSLEHREQPANVYAPAQSYGSFERKYLIVYVHNKGLTDANDCTAEL